MAQAELEASRPSRKPQEKKRGKGFGVRPSGPLALRLSGPPALSALPALPALPAPISGVFG